MGYIYCITSPSLKKYIGQTKNSVEQRFKNHQKKSSNCTLLKRAAKKYGWEHMVVEILVECPNEDLDKNEIECIKRYRTLAPEGYNCTAGGETKKEYCEETRKKTSDSMKKAHREGRAGRCDWTGKKHTEETKQKLRAMDHVKQYTADFRIKNIYYRRRGTVCFTKRNKWMAQSPSPRQKHLGMFKTEEEARLALEKYKKEHPEEFD